MLYIFAIFCRVGVNCLSCDNLTRDYSTHFGNFKQFSLFWQLLEMMSSICFWLPLLTIPTLINFKLNDDLFIGFAILHPTWILAEQSTTLSGNYFIRLKLTTQRTAPRILSDLDVSLQPITTLTLSSPLSTLMSMWPTIVRTRTWRRKKRFAVGTFHPTANDLQQFQSDPHNFKKVFQFQFQFLFYFYFIFIFLSLFSLFLKPVSV